MAIRYISTKSTGFHPEADSNARDFVLIFGDEVDTRSNQAHGRDEVDYRGRRGWVQSDRLMETHPLEVYTIDVGQGDATFIVTSGNRKILIDGGRGDEAFQFLVWKYRLDRPNPQPIILDLLVVSHVDEDHLLGLVNIVQHPFIHIREIIHSGIAKFNAGMDSELGEVIGQGQHRILMTRHNHIQELTGLNLKSSMAAWRDAVQGEGGVVYRAVDSTTGVVDVGDPDLSLRILGPRLEREPTSGQMGYKWLGSAAKTVNGHSVLLRIDFGEVRLLFPGDINEPGANYLLEDPAVHHQLDAHVFKAPHHGSHDFSPDFLRLVHPQISSISSGESPDHGHPRAIFLGMVGKVSRSEQPLIFSTELVAHFAVDADAESLDADDHVDATDPSMLGQARRHFKKRLNGIINIRTDGHTLYCARRVAAGYQFVTYELPAATRDN